MRTGSNGVETKRLDGTATLPHCGVRPLALDRKSTWLYYTDAVFTPGALWRIPVAGGAPEKIVNGVILINYAVLPGGIYYIDRPAGEGGVYFVDKASSAARLQYFNFATRRSTTIVRDLGKVDTPLTATPDGRTILFPRTTFSIDDLMLVENFR